MRCDELKRRVYDGEVMTEELWDHIDGCGECGEEFAPLAAIRTNHPQPSPGLRDRVLDGMPRRGIARQVAAVAAAVLVAVGVGYGFGRAHAAEPRIERVVEVREIPVVHVTDDKELTILAIAAKSVYKDKITCDFNGLNCKGICIDKAVMNEMLPYCPIIQKLDDVSKERPGLLKLMD